MSGAQGKKGPTTVPALGKGKSHVLSLLPLRRHCRRHYRPHRRAERENLPLTSANPKKETHAMPVSPAKYLVFRFTATPHGEGTHPYSGTVTAFDKRHAVQCVVEGMRRAAIHAGRLDLCDALAPEDVRIL